VFSESSGRRVFGSPRPLLQGTYSSNAHTLVRVDVTNDLAKSAALVRTGAGAARRVALTLVISQYHKARPLDLTLAVRCTTCPVRLSPAPGRPPHGHEARGAWDAASAGGCLGSPRFFANPMWQVVVRGAPAVGKGPGGGGGGGVRFFAELLAPKELHVGLRLARGAGAGGRIDTLASAPAGGVGADAGCGDGDPVECGSSGPYTQGYCHLDLSRLEPGVYTLVRPHAPLL